MGDYRQDRGKHSGGSSGRNRSQSNYSGKSGGRSFGRDRGPATMHEAVCDECGKSCEVPFRPTKGKPIYCNVCFESKKPESDRGNERFSQEKYKSQKASTRSDFGGQSSRRDNDGLKEQLVQLNSKMDRLIKAIENMRNTEPAVIEKKAVKTRMLPSAPKTVKKAPKEKSKKIAKKTVTPAPKKKPKKTPALKATKGKKRTAKKTRK